ncbi:glutaredoxin-like domain protein [Bellilinea caldifistulae]|uniref:Glutaredoxin n=1 Tax=Bellilinea caldifistulae TaxID=360411 RepID=A0A0P6XWB0_9CHLR|nr:thioredoxin family protein [Bellilinea caldifistulae]KPL73612.1 glutaredoxin [Bellilinea caldifistulae]GAP10240.1 glutaredoxin-like domain protein [Bellilinea caldifistulae]
MSNLLDDEIRNQVRDVLTGMVHPVEIIFFGSQSEPCEYCEDTRQLLEEVTSLSDKLTLQVFDLNKDAVLARQYNVDKAPGFVILGKSGDNLDDFGIRYAGIPAGHEFTSLINDILIVSKRDSGLSPETREFLNNLNQKVLLQVFVTPSCPYCPRAVVLAHQMALESPMVEAEMIEAMEFNSLADQFNVSGVPHTVINSGKGEVVGAVPESHLVQKIREALA